MKTRKRERSPTEDCEDCMPISKRITRLNIQAANRLSVEDKEHPGSSSENHSCSGSFVEHLSPDVQLPWHQETGCQGDQLSWQQGSDCRGSHSHGNNNNVNYLPCGSSQCDNVQIISNHRNSLQAYATHHGMAVEDLKGYKPELNQSENPHYYHINSILYSAHLEKASRQGSNMKH